MIKALIENYKELTIVGVFAIIMSWYLWYQTRRQAKREDKNDKQQNEDRQFYRDLVSNDLKSLHDSTLENAKLNNQSLVLQKDMIKQFKDHNGHSKEAWNKTIKSLSVICEKLNNIKEGRANHD